MRKIDKNSKNSNDFIASMFGYNDDERPPEVTLLSYATNEQLP